METKGIAIRVDRDLFERIENHELPRNELIQRAVRRYLEEEDDDVIPEDVYNEVYSTLYNIEVQPLKKQIEHQKIVIQLLQKQIEEYKADKEFLKQQLAELTKKKHRWFFKRRRRGDEESIDID